MGVRDIYAEAPSYNDEDDGELTEVRDGAAVDGGGGVRAVLVADGMSSGCGGGTGSSSGLGDGACGDGGGWIGVECGIEQCGCCGDKAGRDSVERRCVGE